MYEQYPEIAVRLDLLHDFVDRKAIPQDLSKVAHVSGVVRRRDDILAENGGYPIPLIEKTTNDTARIEVFQPLRLNFFDRPFSQGPAAAERRQHRGHRARGDALRAQ